MLRQDARVWVRASLSPLLRARRQRPADAARSAGIRGDGLSIIALRSSDKRHHGVAKPCPL
eukprot:4475691-Alexandrium_andersonii.AAC.1